MIFVYKVMSSWKDDLFDSVVFLEENCQKQGYDDGFNEGKFKGWSQGYETGCIQGKQIGNEIGFYKGFVQTWIACCGGNEKIKVKLESLLKLLERDWGDVTRDITTELQQIRAKFKQICAMLNINVEHAGMKITNQLSF